MIVQSREGRRNTTEVNGKKGGGGGDGWEGRRSRSEGNGEERKEKKAFKTTECVCVSSHQRYWCCGILVISSILNLHTSSICKDTVLCGWDIYVFSVNYNLLNRFLAYSTFRTLVRYLQHTTVKY